MLRAWDMKLYALYISLLGMHGSKEISSGFRDMGKNSWLYDFYCLK